KGLSLWGPIGAPLKHQLFHSKGLPSTDVVPPTVGVLREVTVIDLKEGALRPRESTIASCSRRHEKEEQKQDLVVAHRSIPQAKGEDAAGRALTACVALMAEAKREARGCQIAFVKALREAPLAGDSNTAFVAVEGESTAVLTPAGQVDEGQVGKGLTSLPPKADLNVGRGAPFLCPAEVATDITIDGH